MMVDSYWIPLFLILGLTAWAYAAWCARQFRAGPANLTAIHRLLKPRTPDDCPACRQQATTRTPRASPPPPIRPWCEVKSQRGAPKRILTDGFACPNRRCTYYHITDATIHALVGDGTHGKHERIQTYRCQACKTTFSARRHTPLYRLKTASQRIGEVLTALAEGLDVAAAERVFGHRHATITTWLTRAGEHSARLHTRWCRNLYVPHLQLDELRTRLRHRVHTLWLWVTIDPITKIIPVLHLGPRTQDAAHTVIHKLRQQLASTCLPIFSSDGLNLYFYGLTAHFGQWVEGTSRRTRQWQVATGLIYGQVKKTYRRRRLVCAIPVMRCGTHVEFRSTLTRVGLSGRLNTAFIERVNLTVRQSVAALARRTWSTAQVAPQLLLHLEWWRGYYHFVRPHASLRVALAQPINRGGRRQPQRYRQRTPAMAAGLTHRRWTVRNLLAVPLPSESMSTG